MLKVSLESQLETDAYIFKLIYVICMSNHSKGQKISEANHFFLTKFLKKTNQNIFSYSALISWGKIRKIYFSVFVGNENKVILLLKFSDFYYTSYIFEYNLGKIRRLAISIFIIKMVMKSTAIIYLFQILSAPSIILVKMFIMT